MATLLKFLDSNPVQGLGMIFVPEHLFLLPTFKVGLFQLLLGGSMGFGKYTTYLHKLEGHWAFGTRNWKSIVMIISLRVSHIQHLNHLH